MISLDREGVADGVVRRWRGRALVIGALLATLAMTGCGADSGSTAASSLGCAATAAGQPVAVALGARAHNPTPKLTRELGTLLRAAADRSASVAFIRIDGRPSVAYQQTFQTDAGNDVARARDLDAFMNNAFTAFGQTRAQEPEADQLRALDLAGRSVPPGGTVVLLDSGLQTVEPLDYRTGGMLAAEPAEVVAFLAKEKLLPALTGRNVVLAGVGDTAAPQAPLNPRQRANVVDTWSAIAKAAGASCVAVEGTPRDGAALRDVPAVGSVAVPTVESFNPCGQTVLHDSGSVGFHPNVAEFRDPAAARTTLRQLADQVVNGSQRVHLLGTTASVGSVDGRQRLAKQRAEAVMRVLVELGVAADRITTEGAGATWPGRVEDLDQNRTLLPGPAAQNRSVIVTLTCR